MCEGNTKPHRNSSWASLKGWKTKKIEKNEETGYWRKTKTKDIPLVTIFSKHDKVKIIKLMIIYASILRFTCNWNDKLDF